MSHSRIFLTLLITLVFAVIPLAPTTAQGEGLQIRITQVDDSDFPQVTVYVSITGADGKPAGVEPGMIHLFEDGISIQPSQIIGSGQTNPITTLLVMDVSGSMLNNGKLEAAKTAALAYIAQMRSIDLIGLITFNTQVTVSQPITGDLRALKATIENLEADNDTAMYDAIMKAVEILQGKKGRKAIIVLTDGLDNKSTSSETDVAAAVELGSLSISTIGLGDPSAGGSNDGLNEANLRSLAKQAGGMYSFASDTVSLQAIYTSYGRALQSEYIITFTSPSNLRDGTNRNLTVLLGEEGVSEDTAYNPGGVLPEVSSKNWILFGGTLSGLIVLALIPNFISELSEWKKNKLRKTREKESRIKLK